MEPLINRVMNALHNDNAEALKDLLPEILLSEFPGDYIGNVFVSAAAYGYVESYKLIVDEVFKHPNQHDIERALSLAIEGNHHWTANDLLDKTRFYLHGLEHNNVIHMALRSAAWVNNTAIAQQMLEHNFSTSLDAPLSIACSRGHVEIVALMVNSLMKEDEETTAVRPHPKVKRPHPKVKRARVLAESLPVSIRNESHSITAILLAPYLEGVIYFDAPSDILRANKILETVRDEDFATICRQTCFKLLSSKIPKAARQSISRRLQQEEPKDLRLSAEGQTFSTHKDVLSHWSPYFASLSKDQFADSEHVEFGEDMPAASISSILNFAYSGTFECQQQDITTDQQITKLEDLLVAADYFGINCLKREVEDCLDSLVT